MDHNSLLNGHTNSCRNRCLLFSFFLYFFLIYFHNLSEKQVLNGRTNTSLTRANSLRTSRCLLFSLFCCYFLIYFILLVFVSTYFTFVGHCSYTIYIIQLPRRKGISITCYHCAWGT